MGLQLRVDTGPRTPGKGAGLELCNAEDYIDGYFGDVLTLKSKDVEIFVGTLQDLERWMQGFHFARRRSWVRLTDEEISRIDWRANETLDQYARHIEAKCREKNA